jgi:hypothetical protein
MYCEICKFQQTPERQDQLIRHMERSELSCREGTIVWRNNQFWVTMSPVDGETVFNLEIPNYPEPAVPEVVVPRKYAPNVHQGKGGAF